MWPILEAYQPIYVCYSMENVDCVKYRIVITCQVWQGDGADRRLHRIVQPGHRRCHRRDIKISGTELQKAKDQKNFTQKTHLICNISNFATKCVNGPQMKIIKETHGGVCIESLWNTFLFVSSRATEIQTNREVDMIKCDVNTVIGVLAQLPSFSSMALKVK